MPVFYRRPRPLNATQDAGKSLARAGNFLFARGTNSVALNGPEFPQAMRTYPIVFTTGEPRTAVAVLGLRDNENLFLDSAGSWRPDSYIPAYVRRYPFVFMVQPGNADMVLCIDDDSGLLVEDDTRPLFVDGKPTDVVQHALRFCAEFQAQFKATQEFVQALVEHDLLVANETRVVMKSGQQMALRGFQVVSEAKFNALSDAVFLDWRRRGWLHLVYCHLMSMANWSRLVELAGAQGLG
ncbi:MAG TPA: SapC family protein [Alphaproteobacteria bacterium]|nr:SapC family protein [Alphaproteobacteria bacterium]